MYQKELNKKIPGKEEIKVVLGISAQDFKDMFIARKLPLKWLNSNKSQSLSLTVFIFQFFKREYVTWFVSMALAKDFWNKHFYTKAVSLVLTEKEWVA